MKKIFASFLFLMVAAGLGMASFMPKVHAETPIATPEGEKPADDAETRVLFSCPNCGMG